MVTLGSWNNPNIETLVCEVKSITGGKTKQEPLNPYLLPQLDSKSEQFCTPSRMAGSNATDKDLKDTGMVVPIIPSFNSSLAPTETR